jgi:hypothetical protein
VLDVFRATTDAMIDGLANATGDEDEDVLVVPGSSVAAVSCRSV